MRWKEIPAFPNYEVSGTGLVRRKDGRMPRIGKDSNGYPRCTLGRDGKFVGKNIHILVLEAFVGPRPGPINKWDACHKDGSRTNNILSNLKWATRKENVADSIGHGTFIYGERQGLAKLTNQQVLDIKSQHYMGIKQAALAKKYGVSKQQICRIIKGQRRAKDHLSPSRCEGTAK